MSDEFRTLTALDGARRVKDALVEAARRARLSARRRRRYDAGSLSSRRGAQYSTALWVGSLFILFVAPTVVAFIYYTFLASAQYVAETKFTIQSGEAVNVDGVGILTGLPSIGAVQDTQIVTDYVQSRAIVERLQETIDLRQMYGANNIDWVSRFDTDKPVERLVDYWKGKIDVAVQLPGGIVTVTVRAFSAIDALYIMEAVIGLSEALVNDMNKRVWYDNIEFAERDFERASRRLAQARLELERARNSEGILDPTQTGKALADLVTGLKSDELRLQQEYDSQLKHVSETAPQMKSLKARLSAIASQIRDLEAKLTSPPSQQRKAGLLSSSMTKFSELELEHRIAERQYAAAATALVVARATVERRLVYLQTFMRPALPQDARYPKRTLSVIVVLFGGFTLWAALCGLATIVRNHMA